jgi:hypothetical protein
LRIEIYRYCLKPVSPVETNSDWSIDPYCSVLSAASLLRTCKQIKEEGEQVLYAENTFHFWGQYRSFDDVFCLPVQFFRWVKELTINFPPTKSECMLRRDILNYGSTNEPNNSAHGQTMFSMDFLANQLLQYLLHVLCNAPQLRKLNFIIPSDWRDDDDTSSAAHGRPYIHENGQIDSKLHKPDAWKALDAFFRLELPFEVSITRLYLEWERKQHLKLHTRLMNRVRRQYGI